MMPTPSADRRRITRNSCSVSALEMAEVGSSIISMRAFREIALAISTICCSPTRSVFSGRFGLRSSSSRRRYFSASCSWARLSTKPSLLAFSRPINMFSAMESSFTICNSW